MFKNFTSAFKLVKNLDGIRQVVGAAFTALTKLKAVLVYVEQQANDTKLGIILSKYLPSVLSMLSLVIDVFNKYAPLVGVVLTPFTVLDDNLIEELDRSIAELKSLLK